MKFNSYKSLVLGIAALVIGAGIFSYNVIANESFINPTAGCTLQGQSLIDATNAGLVRPSVDSYNGTANIVNGTDCNLLVSFATYTLRGTIEEGWQTLYASTDRTIAPRETADIAVRIPFGCWYQIDLHPLATSPKDFSVPGDYRIIAGGAHINGMAPCTPTKPGSFTVQAQAVCHGPQSIISVDWTKAINGPIPADGGYFIYKNGIYIGNTVTGTHWDDTALLPNQTASYFIKAVTSAGTTDSNTVTATAIDCAPIPTPTPTATPTPTPTATPTPKPSHTPYPTPTPKPSHTPYPTPTPMPSGEVQCPMNWVHKVVNSTVVCVAQNQEQNQSQIQNNNQNQDVNQNVTATGGSSSSGSSSSSNFDLKINN